MAQVSDFVSVELSISAASLTRPGFGKPLILAYDCPGSFQGLYQEYGSAAAVAAAGFSTTGATYQMAARMFAQNPCPPIVAIGKGTNPPTQQFTLTPNGVPASGNVYTWELDGQTYYVTFASAWAGATVYAVGALVTQGGFLYQCTVAGTSGASGPGATAATAQNSGSITDNTVTWAYKGIGSSTMTVAGLCTAVAAAMDQAWAVSTLYAPGVVVVNGGRVYVCSSVVGNGESATAGGPTGTGTHIADFQTANTNGVYWNYVAQAMTIADVAGTSVTATAAVAGEWHSLGLTPLQSTTLGQAQTHADGATATDLTNILAQNATWYGFCTAFNSKAVVVAADGWAEANDKLYLAQTQDSAVINVAAQTGTDVAVTLAGSSALRTALIYKSTTADFADAAWLGACLPLTPGSETWAFKTLVGVPTESGLYALSETQRSNAAGSGGGPGGKYVNLYENVGGANVTEKGTVSGNEWIDVIRGKDWLQVNMSIDVFAAIIAGQKLPYTDAGIAGIEAAIRSDLKQGVAAGFLSNNPAPTVTVPLVANVSASDKQNRVLNGVTFAATMAGAIQSANIQGTLSF